MDQDKRSCWRCGRLTLCFWEACDGCLETEVVACERCVAETRGAVLDHQAAGHRRTCGKLFDSVGDGGRPGRARVVLTPVVQRIEATIGRRLSRVRVHRQKIGCT